MQDYLVAVGLEDAANMGYFTHRDRITGSVNGEITSFVDAADVQTLDVGFA